MLNIFRAFSLLFCLCCLPLAADVDGIAPSPYLAVDDPLLEASEVEVVENLVLATEKNLQSQQRLLELLRDFQAARESFRKNESKETAGVVINDAVQIVELIDGNYLSSLFRQDFLTEVKVIAKMANRQALNRP
jgi:hypothetical protein